HLPARRAVQSRHISQIAVNCLEGVRQGVPADRQVTNPKRQNDNPCALIQEPNPGPIKKHDQPDAEQYAGQEEGKPGEPAAEIRNPKPETRRKTESRNPKAGGGAACAGEEAKKYNRGSGGGGEGEGVPNGAL